LAKNRENPQNRRKVGILGIPDPGSGGVLHQPLAPGPRGSPERGGWPGPSGTPFRGSRETPPGPRDPGTPARNRGAPARGVDVKPPSAGLPGPGSGALRDPGVRKGPPQPLGRGPPGDQDPRGPGLRDPGPRTGLPGRAPGSPWASQVPGSPRPLGVLHQPLAAGPRGSRRGTPGTGVPGRHGAPSPSRPSGP